MGRKSKFSELEKLKAIEDYLSGQITVSQIIREIKVDRRAFYTWLNKYKMHGPEGLNKVTQNKYYPEVLKLQAVRDYLDGNSSQDEVCRKYKITNHSILQKWIKRYNGYETFGTHNAQGGKYMTKGRKTTYEERAEIVAFCIANNYNYQLTSEQFQVSYQQVYSWVQKYKEQGYEALLDNRGKRKKTEELSESEKVVAQLKLLKAENEHLKMENDFLKKLDEVERRRESAEKSKKTDIQS